MNPLLSRIKKLSGERARMLAEGRDTRDLSRRIGKLERMYGRYLAEDTSATGGPSGAVAGSAVGGGGVAMSNASLAGMGSVVSPQASSLAGSTMGPNYAAGGGRDGSGDVAFPFPVGGRNPMYQKAEMGKSHGAMTGKKSRKKRLGMKQLRDILSKRQDYTGGAERKLPRVMNWQDFHKADMSRVKKLKY